MIYYCTNCWNEIKKNEKVCPYCGVNQSIIENKSYIKKLINALNHPEPQTPIRAANILGELKTKEAVPHLIKKLQTENDPFVVEAIVNALIRIDLVGTKSNIIEILSKNSPVTVKHLLMKLEKSQYE